MILVVFITCPGVIAGTSLPITGLADDMHAISVLSRPEGQFKPFYPKKPVSAHFIIHDGPRFIRKSNRRGVGQS